MSPSVQIDRRQFTAAAAATLFATAGTAHQQPTRQIPTNKAQIVISLDLEMSRHYPRRGMVEWDYQKGNLDEATKRYSVQAARLARQLGGVVHFFCVGRVLEQENIDWLLEIAEAGHPIGNHTYDHVNVKATTPEAAQFRFQRSPWLVRGKTVKQVIRENIRLTTVALQERTGITNNGFRTPGGFHNGLHDQEAIQQLLLELGFTWISSKYPRHSSGMPRKEPTEDVFRSIVDAQREAQPFVYPSGLMELPMSPISDVNAFRSNFWKRSYFLEAVRRSVQWAIETGSVFDLLCHPSCLVVEDPQMETIRLICNLVRDNADRAEIVGLDTVAQNVSRGR